MAKIRRATCAVGTMVGGVDWHPRAASQAGHRSAACSRTAQDSAPEPSHQTVELKVKRHPPPGREAQAGHEKPPYRSHGGVPRREAEDWGKDASPSADSNGSRILGSLAWRLGHRWSMTSLDREAPVAPNKLVCFPRLALPSRWRGFQFQTLCDFLPLTQPSGSRSAFSGLWRWH
jgi:hypothetical protein